MNKKYKQVFEYQNLRYSDTGVFRKSHFDAIVKFNELHKNKYFTIIHNGVKFSNYVGVIQVGGLTIEILPKVDKNYNDKDSDKALWQNVLLNMLKVCNLINVESFSKAKLKIKQYNSILDVYFDTYLNEIEKLIRKGLIKKYRKTQSNQNTLKGKLLHSQNIQKNLVHKERFYCEHQVYDTNHLLHQIIYKALLILKNFVNKSLSDKLNRLLYEFQDIEHINIHKSHFDKITISRKNNDYQTAIDIAKIIILNYSPSLNVGHENLLTLLFDMNALWEEYIYRILQKNKTEDMSISFQNKNSQKFWENKTIRPDIVLKNKGVNFIIDTKWKIVENNNPSDDDLKQMLVYNLHWKSDKALLLYPKVNQEDSEFGKFHYKHSKCKLGFVDIIDGGNIRDGKDIAKEIFEKFN